MSLVNQLSGRVNHDARTVSKVVQLLDDGATIPFIARYRKEVTGSMDEVILSDIQNEYKKLQQLIARKESILSSIEEQGGLTSDLRSKINQCWVETELEDLYLPFKRKTKTKAAVARENGLEALAKIIMTQRSNNLESQAGRFINKNVKNIEEAFEGAKHNISEWISENSKIRDIVRNEFEKYGFISSKVAKDKEQEGEKFKDYFKFEEKLSKIPSHRLLAILRGESEGFLKVKVDIDNERILQRINRYYIKSRSEAAIYIEESIEDSLKRLIVPSIRNESLKMYKDKADDEAIKVFARNAQELLLSSPLGAKRIMGIDPGYRTGCKVVCLDEKGDLQINKTIYPHPPQNLITEAQFVIDDLVGKYKIEAFAIGNGTAGKETYQWISKTYRNTGIEVFLVNEDGASIYSASDIAREEFPDKDITVRGAVSIGRRLMDPLAELVKIDPKSIGVGQYQHDVNQKKLKDSLTETVELCVNKVGVNLNTASKHLLSYVSGLGPGLADNIIQYRTQNNRFEDIKELLKVPRLGSKAFEQCAGFLRITGGKNPLDNTGVHPESYPIVEKMLKKLRKSIDQLVGDEVLLKEIVLQEFVTEEVGLPTLKDIINELKKPGLDPREKAKAVSFTKGIESISDLNVGMILKGVVTNITNFGAFVDIGIKESALLHISQITDRFISDPAEVLSINQQVELKIIDVDVNRKRISVSMKQVKK